jgi:hypothetical protein
MAEDKNHCTYIYKQCSHGESIWGSALPVLISEILDFSEHSTNYEVAFYFTLNRDHYLVTIADKNFDDF